MLSQREGKKEGKKKKRLLLPKSIAISLGQRGRKHFLD
jgi:hypothetical protein